MKLAAIAATTALTAALVVAPAPAEAHGLCWAGLCGFVSNSSASNASVHYACANGNWRWLHPGDKSSRHCKDVNKIHTSPTKRTYRLMNVAGLRKWIPLRKGVTYDVHDGQTYFLKVRR